MLITEIALFPETLCILCGNSTIPAGELYFCSKACQSLADISAPFLIEIPPRHDIFERGISPPYFLHPQNDVYLSVAEIFTSEWQTSETHCPNVKRIYRIVMRKGFFEESFMKYWWVTSSVFQLQFRAQWPRNMKHEEISRSAKKKGCKLSRTFKVASFLARVCFWGSRERWAMLLQEVFAVLHRKVVI